MNKNKNFFLNCKLFLLLGLLLSLSGCSLFHKGNKYKIKKINKLARSSRIEDRDSAAFFFYRIGKYEQASPILEDLLGTYRGTKRGEAILFALAETRFHLRDYLTAAHYYELYQTYYPLGERSEEAAFQEAYCYYLLSLVPELDQTDTRTAIEKFHLFLVHYPESRHSQQVIKYLEELQNKIASKAYQNALLYYKMGYYRAAKTALNLFLKDFPEFSNRDEAYYYLVLATKAYADLSVETKKLERYLEALEYYLKFAALYPNSPYLKKLESTIEEIEKNRKAYEKAK
jgi:outer membrane protein assembly factor BamD